jgi:hypothetical protein
MGLDNAETKEKLYTHNFNETVNIILKYLRAAKRILAVPHHKLITEHEVTPHYKSRRTDIRSEKWLQKHPEFIRRSDAGIQAEKIRKRLIIGRMEV